MLLLGLLGCGGASKPVADAGLTQVLDDLVDVPLVHATDDQKKLFGQGDRRFGTVFAANDGLGPLYVRNQCNACHQQAEKGPGLVQKMALVEADGFTPVPDDGGDWPYGHTIRPYAVQSGETPIDPPDAGPLDGGEALLISTRIGPALFGRGYLEAIADSEILRVEGEQETRTDGIHGVANRVTYHSQANPDPTFDPYGFGQTGLLGRFGLKGRVATLADFAADAYQGDMGLTSPMRPVELPNPDHLTDDAKPGLDLDADTVNLTAMYVRLIEIPRRPPPDPTGQAAFSSARCDVCHVPSLHTRSDYPIAALANIDAPVFTDLLLHDLGDAMADGIIDESASSRQWKTAPLIGVKYERNFLHDGRAHDLAEAIHAHAGPGSEANDSVARFDALSDADRQALLAFVGAL